MSTCKLSMKSSPIQFDVATLLVRKDNIGWKCLRRPSSSNICRQGGQRCVSLIGSYLICSYLSYMFYLYISITVISHPCPETLTSHSSESTNCVAIAIFLSSILFIVLPTRTRHVQVLVFHLLPCSWLQQEEPWKVRKPGGGTYSLFWPSPTSFRP